MSDPSSEKRRYPRLKKACLLRYRVVEGEVLSQEGAEALTVNISGGGVAFQVSEAIAPGALLALQLQACNNKICLAPEILRFPISLVGPD